MKVYKPVSRNPVAKFYYKGTHSHPIRRTVVVTESNPRYFRGYEIREGDITRLVKDAPVKTYSRSKIATYKQLGACKHRNAGLPVTTLKRINLFDFVFTGP